jgi:hypothetical protein
MFLPFRFDMLAPLFFAKKICTQVCPSNLLGADKFKTICVIGLKGQH